MTTFAGSSEMAFPLRNVAQAVQSAVAQLDRPADLLRSVSYAIVKLEAVRVTAVREMRHAGVPWAEVAVALGITRQAAQQRYGKKKLSTHVDLTVLELDL